MCGNLTDSLPLKFQNSERCIEENCSSLETIDEHLPNMQNSEDLLFITHEDPEECSDHNINTPLSPKIIQKYPYG